jgi:hypothetical protein
MNEYELSKLKRKLIEAIEISHKPKDKLYWWAYITALLDFGVIDEVQYRTLRNMIEILIKEAKK